MPSTVGDMMSLMSLDLSINQLTGDIPATIGQLSSLTYEFQSATNVNDSVRVQLNQPEWPLLPIEPSCDIDDD